MRRPRSGCRRSAASCSGTCRSRSRSRSRSSGDTATRCCRRRSRSGSRCRRSCSSGRCSCGRSRRVGSARSRSQSGSGALVTLVAWAIIGFAGLAEYPDLLERLSEIQSERSYSIVGMASTLGLAEGVGQRRDARRRWRAARRLRRARSARRRGAVVHVRGRGDARAEPDRLAALPRPAPRAARDPATALLLPLAAARRCSG